MWEERPSLFSSFSLKNKFLWCFLTSPVPQCSDTHTSYYICKCCWTSPRTIATQASKHFEWNMVDRFLIYVFLFTNFVFVVGFSSGWSLARSYIAFITFPKSTSHNSEDMKLKVILQFTEQDGIEALWGRLVESGFGTF